MDDAQLAADMRGISDRWSILSDERGYAGICLAFAARRIDELAADLAAWKARAERATTLAHAAREMLILVCNGDEPNDSEVHAYLAATKSHRSECACMFGIEES